MFEIEMYNYYFASYKEVKNSDATIFWIGWREENR
jgi:hypothetical protein